MARPARLRGAARPRVLLVAPHSSYRIPAYVRAARALGGELLIASKSRYSLVGELAAGMYVDLGDPDAACEALTAEARRRPIEAVVGSDDVTVEIASRVAERLGLAHNPPAAARLARRKDLARARLAEAGLPVPEHRRLDLERDPRPQLAGLRYPVVLKPLALAASRGVIRANDSEELAAACGRIRAILAAEPLL
ncbi:MAG: phosphoribosylglycinamide synthetase, partial [Gammaproteobacteria bacterium]|nr:phosphoribosylglycinamide synthetase [Gammaproteobacteria bacterium]